VILQCALAMRTGLKDALAVVPSAHRKPFWLYPNLLSLDAPLVAVAWLYIFAKTWRVDYLPWVAYVSLACVTWVIYVTARLLDASLRDGTAARLHPRHEFYRKYQVLLRNIALVAGLGSVALAVVGLPTTIYSYGLLGAVMLVGFFALSVFSTVEPDHLPYGRNILAGMCFAYGTAMSAHAFTRFGAGDLLVSSELICFVVLCILHISAIGLWDCANTAGDLETKAANELALTLPLTLLGGAALVFAFNESEITTRPFFYAILTGAALLQILNRIRARFSMDGLRVLAGFTLLAPVVVFWVSSS